MVDERGLWWIQCCLIYYHPLSYRHQFFQKSVKKSYLSATNCLMWIRVWDEWGTCGASGTKTYGQIRLLLGPSCVKSSQICIWIVLGVYFYNMGHVWNLSFCICIRLTILVSKFEISAIYQPFCLKISVMWGIISVVLCIKS